MEYTTADLYWEDNNNSWYKTKYENHTYFYHNDIVSCWSGSARVWSNTFFEAKRKTHECIWSKLDEKFIRDTIKLSHYQEGWKGRMEYPGTTNQNYGNQATICESSLGRGAKRRFTLLLDDDVYQEVISSAIENEMRRNTYLNDLIRNSMVAEVSV